MGSWQKLLDEMKRCRDGVEVDRNVPEWPPPYWPPEKKRYEFPSVFLRAWLAGLAIVVSAGVFILCQMNVSPARLVPDYRLATSHRDFPTTTVVSSRQDGKSRIWTGSKGAGVATFDVDALFWEKSMTKENTGGALLSNHVADLDLSPGVLGYVCEEAEGSRRGLVFSDMPHRGVSAAFWKTPFLDFSHLGQTSGNNLTCVARGLSQGSLLVGSNGFGIGRYERASRQWLGAIDQAHGQISSDVVYDLLHSPAGLLVANEKGIDVCRLENKRWDLHSTISGLGMRGVKRLYPTEMQDAGIDLWYVSVGQGLGAVEIDPRGTEQSKSRLISERFVEGLTLDSCADAAYEPIDSHLWVAFNKQNGIGLARYAFGDHDWAGTSGPIKTREMCCLGVQRNGSGLMGTSDGIWQAKDNGEQNLEALHRGLRGEKITEIISTPSLTFAHSQWAAPSDQSATRIRGVAVDVTEDDRWQWYDFIGPRRFHGLNLSDFLCVSRSGDSEIYYFGTRGKGIGVFNAKTREIFQQFSKDSLGPRYAVSSEGMSAGARYGRRTNDAQGVRGNSPERQSAREAVVAEQDFDRPFLALPESTIIDILSPRADQLAVVGGRHSLLAYDGRAWQYVIAPSDFRGRPDRLSGSATLGTQIVVAADPTVGMYDMDTHRWRHLPELAGVRTLRSTGQQLWALTEKGGLHRWLGSGQNWTEIAQKVTAFAGGEDYMAAILGDPSDIKKLLLADGQGTVASVTAPVALASNISKWKTTCVDGSTLYIADNAGHLARYDLASHEWKTIEWPEGIATASALEATQAGLWMLGENGVLKLWKAKSSSWAEQQIYTDVKTMTCDGSRVVIELTEDRSAGASEQPKVCRLHDDEQQQIIVGRALPGDPRTSHTAVDFAGLLFFGSDQGIARYQRTTHDWRGYPTERDRLRQFAPTEGFLYAFLTFTSGEPGRVARYRPEEDEIEFVRDPADPAEDLAVSRLASEGTLAAMQRPRSDVLIVSDNNPETASVVYPSSGLDWRSQQVLCAAEFGQALYMGTDRGRVVAYQAANNGLPRWSKLDLAGVGAGSSSAPGEAVRKLLPLNDNGIVVVVRDNSIEVVTPSPTDPQSPQSVQSIVSNAARCDAWDAGGGKIMYAASLSETDKAANCYSVVGRAEVAGQLSTRAYVGPGLISEPTSKIGRTRTVAEIKAAEDVLIFRADSEGNLGHYSMSEHSWSKDDISGVTKLLASLGRLWAHDSQSMSLYHLVLSGGGAAWERYGDLGSVVDLVGDNSGLLIRHANGYVELMEIGSDGAVQRTNLTASVEEEAQTGDLVACAEIGDDLICSFAQAGTYVYKLGSHQWARILDSRVLQFARTGQNGGSLYAVLDDGSVVRWTSTDVEAVEAVETPRNVRRLLHVEGRLWVSTTEGGLYALSPTDEWVCYSGPEHRITAPAWQPITAATEWNNLLLLATGNNASKIDIYDPRAQKWNECALPTGVAERFISSGEELFVLSMPEKQQRSLMRFDLNTGQLETVANLRNVTVHNDRLWAVDTEGMILTFEQNTLPASRFHREGLAPSLAPNGSILNIVTVENDLIALLDNGHVWHHAVDDLGWRALLSESWDASSGFRRQLLLVNGALLCSSPDGRMLLYDPAKDQYEPTVNVLKLSEQVSTPAKWEARSSDGAFQVRAAKSGTWMDVGQGRLPADDISDLSVDSKFVYALTNAGGVRVLDRATKKQVNTTLDSESLLKKFKRPSPLVFESATFRCEQAAKGSWATADPAVRYRIGQKTGPAQKYDRELVPHAADGQIGLVEQWLGDPVVDGRTVYAAIPSGVAKVATNTNQMRITKVYNLCQPTEIPVLAREQGRIFCRTSAEKYFTLDRSKDQWINVAGVLLSQARKAFDKNKNTIRSSALGDTWSLTLDDAGYRIHLRAKGGKLCEVTLNGASFGFDRTACMSLGKDVIRLYTADGLTTYARGPADGAPQLIDRNTKVPESMVAEVYHHIVIPGEESRLRLLRADQKRAWEHTTQWNATDADSLARSFERATPTLLSGQSCKWARNERVELIYSVGSTPVKTSFDPNTGRLNIDRVNAIGAIDGGYWAITCSGICQFTDAGTVVHLNEDPAYAWSAKAHLTVVEYGGRKRLYAHVISKRTGKAVVLRFDGRSWSQVLDANEMKAINESAKWLLRGQTWRALRDDLTTAGPQRISRHWDWQKADEFMEVTWDPGHPQYPGVFDFERINDILIHEQQLWLATDCGVVQVDCRQGRISSIIQPGGERNVQALIVRRGVVYAKTSKATYYWDNRSGRWILTTQPAFSPPSLFVDSENWRVERKGAEWDIECRLAKADKALTKVKFLPAGPNRYRFDFDSVHSVAANGKTLMLSTEKGLIQRSGASATDARLCPGPTGQVRIASGTLLAYGKKEDRTILYRERGALLAFNDGAGKWIRVSADEERRIRSLSEKIISWNNVWQTHANPGANVEVFVKLPQDSTYKPTTFDNAVGLFGFDIFHDVAMCDSRLSQTGIFVATDSGIARIRGDGQWERLYSDRDVDGIAASPVSHLAGYGGKELMAKIGAGGSGAAGEYASYSPWEDLWQMEGRDSNAQDQFAQLRATIEDDPESWRILDLAEYNKHKGRKRPSQEQSIGLAWKGEPVWLVGENNTLRFAHDVVHAIELHGQDVWTATSGGIVRYQTDGDDLSTLDIAEPEIHASDFCQGYDIWSPPTAPGITAVSASSESTRLFCFSPRDARSPGKGNLSYYESQRCYFLNENAKRFVGTDRKEPAFREAVDSLVGLRDDFWSWTRIGPEKLEIAFNEQSADIPADYEWLGQGTFRFFETTYSPDRAKRSRTMLTCYGKVFFVTEGGIMSYSAETGDPSKLYAIASSNGSSLPKTLENIRALHFDPEHQKLFARDSAGNVFSYDRPQDSRSDSWRIHDRDSDPFEEADVVVQNDLLKWRQRETGPQVTLTNSDIPPSKAYGLFHNGKFSFDYVHTLAFNGDKVWLATAGGVVRVDRKDRRIEHIYAASFPYAEDKDLPDVREVVVDENAPGRALCARTGNLQTFRLSQGGWRPVPTQTVASVFQEAYTRHSDAFWDWVQPPHGIYVELHQTHPADLKLGTACSDAHATLMNQGRFTWDDLSEVSFRDDTVLFTTPAGICHYRYESAAETAEFVSLYGTASNKDMEDIPMLALERLISTDEGAVLTWNQSHVFRGEKSGKYWSWKVDEQLTPKIIISRKELTDKTGLWTLAKSNNARSIRTSLVAPGKLDLSRRLKVRDTIPDVSRAIVTDRGIWCPTERDLIWIDTSLLLKQRGRLVKNLIIVALMACAYAYTKKRSVLPDGPAAKEVLR